MKVNLKNSHMKSCGSLEASLTLDIFIKGAESHLEGETSLRFTDETKTDMGQSQSNQKPKPGDLIEMPRGFYSHWAVFVGDGDVVHVTSPPADQIPGIVSNSISVPGIISDTLRSVLTEKVMVKREKLEDVAGNSTWRINNILDKKCEPRPAPIIVEEALMQVGNVIDYSVYWKNCEHFATKLRYGEAVSLQAKKAEVATFYVPFYGRMLVVSPVPVMAAAAFDRLIGPWTD